MENMSNHRWVVLEKSIDHSCINLAKAHEFKKIPEDNVIRIFFDRKFTDIEFKNAQDMTDTYEQLISMTDAYEQLIMSRLGKINE